MLNTFCRNSFVLFTLLIYCIFLSGCNKFIDFQDPKIKEIRKKLALVKTPANKYPTEGKIRIKDSNIVLYDSDINIGTYRRQNRESGAGVLAKVKGQLIRGAYGENNQFHSVNAFLVGFSPFTAKDPWEVWKAIALHTKYQSDDHTDSNLQDLWKTSVSTFDSKRGDCEDLSILVADWLISLGYDARVVLGMMKDFRGEEEAHAWVVYKDPRDFQWRLIESTSNPPRNKKIPLADQKTKYKPSIMFNRNYLWTNPSDPGLGSNKELLNESKGTYKHSSIKWRLESEYTANQQKNSFLKNPSSRAPLRGRQNFYNAITKKGKLFRWSKSHLYYYFNPKDRIPRRVKSQFRSSFSIWQRKSGIFKFTETQNRRKSNIIIEASNSNNAEISRGEIFPRATFDNNGNKVNEYLMFNTTFKIPRKYFSAGKREKDRRILKNLFIYQIGVILGLAHSDNYKHCMSPWKHETALERDCTNLTAETNTLRIIYNKAL